jgi:hypothetical protein
MSETPISPLRARMIEDMSVRKFGEKTQNDYIRHVKTFSTFLGRSPATAEDLRQYQVHQSTTGVPPHLASGLLNAGPRPWRMSRAWRPGRHPKPVTKPAVSKRSKESRLLDHLVGAEEQRERDRQAKSLCGLDVNQQFVLLHLLYGAGYPPL